jgi:predicted MFS family arabinose efflux permease
MGYMMFNAAMTIGRLTGDRIVAALGPYKVLIFGGALTFAGFALALTVDWMPGTMAGFVLIGLGAANLVPVLFSATGRQIVMPAGMAIAAVTTTGYAGILAGPALIGLAAHATSLPTAFWMLGGMVLLLPACAHIVVGKAR